jgi:hypothetical protein
MGRGEYFDLRGTKKRRISGLERKQEDENI